MLAARGDFAKEYPDVVRRVAKVNRQALQWALSNKSQAIALGAKELQLSKEDAAKLFEWSHFYSDLTQKDIDALQNSQRFLLEQKMMNRSVDINTLIFE